MSDTIKRLEIAKKPSRQLDAAIWATIQRVKLIEFDDSGTGERLAYDGQLQIPDLPGISHYTSSIDSALALVPLGWHGDVSFGKDIHGEGKQMVSMQLSSKTATAVGATSAIAICIAALKARALSEAGS